MEQAPTYPHRSMLVVNKKTGIVHRMAAEKLRLPYKKQQVVCGWRCHKKLRVALFKTIRTQIRRDDVTCRKCFPAAEKMVGTSVHQTAESEEDIIEQFDD